MDFIRLIEQQLERKASLNYQPRYSADVLATWADIGKAKELLQWQPEIPFEEGIRRLIHWYLENQEWAADINTS